MSNFQLTLTAEEKSLLLEVMEAALKNALVTEHRTDALTLRKDLVERENRLTSILQKLKAAS